MAESPGLSGLGETAWGGSGAFSFSSRSGGNCVRAASASGLGKERTPSATAAAAPFTLSMHLLLRPATISLTLGLQPVSVVGAVLFAHFFNSGYGLTATMTAETAVSTAGTVDPRASP